MTWQAVALMALTLVSTPAQARDVDDSYSIARRFEKYLGQYPGIAWAPVAPQPGQTMLFDRLYKTVGDRDLHIDIFRPAPAHLRDQAIVLVHGGAWRSGTKAHFYDLATRLAGRGYTVFLPEYRLSPEAPYPAGAQDVSDAVAWARAHAGEFGLSGRRIALGGASSGGQMASMIAMAQEEALFASPANGDARANALIDMDGVLDFTTPGALKYEDAAGPASSAAKWLGGDYAHAPARWREASAAAHVTAKAPPTLIISSGIPRFTEGKDTVIATLSQHHIPVRWYAFANAPHDFWLFEPWLPTLVDQVDGFLASLPDQGHGPRPDQGK